MLYSLFVLTLGIYLGQEYTIPNVRIIGINLLQYLTDDKAISLAKYLENLKNENIRENNVEENSSILDKFFKSK